jgi:uncharacterized protein (DUF302 family)
MMILDRVKWYLLVLKEMDMLDHLSFQVKMPEPFERVIEKVTAALKEEGFGVLTEINVQSTLKEKLGVDFRKYAILGACNPPLAHRVLEEDPRMGLLLPCNVTVEEVEEGCLVSLVNPEAMLGMGNLSDQQTIQEIAWEAGQRIERVARALGG